MTYKVLTLAVSVSALVTGCAKKVPATGPVPQPNPQPVVSANVKDRVKDMRDLCAQLTQLSDRLPGPDDQTQRDLMRQAFDLSSRILPLLMGPAEADGQFRLQQRIVADARDQLARPANNRLAQEPTVDAGLRAIYNALVRVSQESFYTSQGITAGITELENRVNALDTVRGPAHREAAAEATAQAVDVMTQMTRIYEARLNHRTPEPAVPNPKRASEQPPAAK